MPLFIKPCTSRSPRLGIYVCGGWNTRSPSRTSIFFGTRVSTTGLIISPSTLPRDIISWCTSSISNAPVLSSILGCSLAYLSVPARVCWYRRIHVPALSSQQPTLRSHKSTNVTIYLPFFTYHTKTGIKKQPKTTYVRILHMNLHKSLRSATKQSSKQFLFFLNIRTVCTKKCTYTHNY